MHPSHVLISVSLNSETKILPIDFFLSKFLHSHFLLILPQATFILLVNDKALEKTNLQF